MLSFSISYWDLIKFHYFADTTERADRRWKTGWRQGEDRVTLQIDLLWDRKGIRKSVFQFPLGMVNFRIFFDLKIMVSTHTKDFCEKISPTHQILKKNLKLPDSYNMLQQVAKM